MKPSLHPPTHSTTIPNTRKSNRTRHDIARQIQEDEEREAAQKAAEQDIDFHGSLDGFGFSWSWRYIALFSDWSQSDQGDLVLVVSFRPFQE